MPRLTVRIPKYRLHKPSGRAVVTIAGRDVYLGAHGTSESKAEYNRVIGQRQLSGRPMARPAPSAEATVDELIAPYLEFARSYYIKNGRATSSQEGVRRALRHLHERYGAVPASQFGPLMLKALRQTMIDRGTWSRTTINQAVEVIKRMFKWAAENELVDANAYHRLRTLSGLRKGRSPARESRPVKPVPEDHIDRTLRWSPAPVAAMIQLQRYTGMRPEEVVIMRLRDLDQSGKAWIYTPSSHKTEHHGRQRRIFLGPKAQCVLMPYLAIAPEQYLFRPTEAEARMRAQRRAQRTTPLSCGNRAGTTANGRQREHPASVTPPTPITARSHARVSRPSPRPSIWRGFA